MVVVTVDMWPGGSKEKAYRLGRMFIWNVLNKGQTADYKVAVMKKPHADASGPTVANTLRSGGVQNYPKLSYNMWRLVVRSLRSAFPEER